MHQVHYASIDEVPAEGDVSGVSIQYTLVPQLKSDVVNPDGVTLLADIPAGWST